jgi:hypothetical protein
MPEKDSVMRMLRDEFARWDRLLTQMDEEDILSPRFPEGWSLKDVLAHLYAWQRRSVARAEAGLFDHAPQLGDWPAGFDPAEEEPVDEVNAWIYATHRDLDWPTIYQSWRLTFLRLIQLGSLLPEDTLIQKDRFAWLPGYALIDVFTGSLEHHREHWDMLHEGLGDSAAG